MNTVVVNGLEKKEIKTRKLAAKKKKTKCLRATLTHLEFTSHMMQTSTTNSQTTVTAIWSVFCNL